MQQKDEEERSDIGTGYEIDGVRKEKERLTAAQPRASLEITMKSYFLHS